MSDSGEKGRETTDKKREVLSAKTNTRIGFWNVRTMNETGKLSQVTVEMLCYNLCILGISESRCTRSDRCRTKTGERVLYSGSDDDQRHDQTLTITALSRTGLPLQTGTLESQFFPTQSILPLPSKSWLLSQ